MTPTQEIREEAEKLCRALGLSPWDGAPGPAAQADIELIVRYLDAAKAKAWREGLRAGWARSSEMTNPYQSAPSDKEKAE